MKKIYNKLKSEKADSAPRYRSENGAFCQKLLTTVNCKIFSQKKYRFRCVTFQMSSPLTIMNQRFL